MTFMTLSSEAHLLRLQLLGYMYFPDDEGKRAELNLTATARATAKAEQPMVLSSEEAGMLSNSPGYDAFGELIRRAALQGGIPAGETLLTLLSMYASNTKLSLGRAQYLMSRGITPKKQMSEGRLPRSNRSLRNAWSGFRRVAHFWAALQLNAEGEMPECSLAEHPPKFLSLAVSLFDRAIDLPLDQPLFSADAWLPPPGISRLPLTIFPLAQQEIESLKEYIPGATRE